MTFSYHNHTPLCRHAFGTPAEYARAAFEGGYERFGFSDHTPQFFRPDYLSPSRMRMEETAGYIASLLALREEYRGRMEILIGFETEFYPDIFPALADFYRGLPIDYIILGQHGFGIPEGEEGWINSFVLTDSAERLIGYTDSVIAALNTGLFSCVAHPDVLHYVGDDDLYREQARRLIGAAVAAGVPLELNLYGLSDGRHYPTPLFWQEAGAMGAQVVFGVDAHKTERVVPTGEMPDALRFADRFGLDLRDGFALRAVGKRADKSD